MDNSGDRLTESHEIVMQVEESFFGLLEDTREVTVNPSIQSSCYYHLAKGKRYVILGYKKTPDSKVVQSGACYGNFAVEGNEHLLAAIRRVRDTGKSSIVGSVYNPLRRPHESDRAGIRILANGPTGVLSTTSDDRGHFEFFDVARGEWSISLADDNYVSNDLQPVSSTVSVGYGCVQTFLSAWTDGQIRGRVFDSSGKPIGGVPVQAFLGGADDSVGFSVRAFRESVSDANGNYGLRGVPAARILIGVNGETGEDRGVWPTTFFESATSRDRATPVVLAEFERRDGIDLRLPPARIPAEILVEVYYADGRRATKVTLTLRDENDNVLGRTHADNRAPSSSVPLRLTGYLEETYLVQAMASQYLDTGTYAFYEGSATVGKLVESSTTVRVTLEKVSH